MITEIKTAANYYGHLNVKKEDGKFYWCVENYDGLYWSEIPESLYIELIKYNDSVVDD